MCPHAQLPPRHVCWSKGVAIQPSAPGVPVSVSHRGSGAFAIVPLHSARFVSLSRWLVSSPAPVKRGADTQCPQWTISIKLGPFLKLLWVALPLASSTPITPQSAEAFSPIRTGQCHSQALRRFYAVLGHQISQLAPTPLLIIGELSVRASSLRAHQRPLPMSSQLGLSRPPSCGLASRQAPPVLPAAGARLRCFSQGALALLPLEVSGGQEGASVWVPLYQDINLRRASGLSSYRRLLTP
ncbi:hypothetical protein NDU88_004174 [Pleurodeles waltl]|uniref:Uncharacterized protein n=1 Tax=Pleurodeles waltl TaxID=8319 RepID=A0AAV7MSR1_PLEWA|nr:hypothetical protein NDU88_004174 [Pleurodeles waltl]